MSKLASTFEFVGKIQTMKDATLNQVGKLGATWQGSSYKAILMNDNGSHFLDFFGMDAKNGVNFLPRTIKMGDLEYEVSYEDRYNPEVLKKVPNQYKSIVKLLGEENEFIFQNDFMNFIYASIPTWKDKFFRVRGRVEFNMGKDNKVNYRKFRPNYIEEITEADMKSYPNQSKVNLQLFYPEGTLMPELFKGNEIDTDLLASMEYKIPLTVFVEQANTNKDTKANFPILYLPLEVMFDFSRYDLTNETHRRMMRYMLNNFNVEGDNVFTSCWSLVDVNKQEKIEYSEADIEAMLTPEEKEAIEIWGLSKEEVIAKKNGQSVYGDRVTQLKLVTPNTMMLFREVADTVDKLSLEVYKNISVPISEPVKKEEPKPTAQTNGAINMDDFAGLVG